LIHIVLLKEGFYFSDFKAYDKAAQSLVSGEGFGLDFARPPLYPVFLALNYLLCGIHLFPIRFIQAVLGAYSSVLIFSIAERILGRGAARVAGWISVVYPYYIFITGLLYPTLLTTVLLIAMVYFLLQYSNLKAFKYLLFAAFCLGLASLAVPVCLAFVPFLVLWFLFISGMPFLRAGLISLLFILVVVVTLAPWTYYGMQHYGGLILVDPRVEKHLPIIESPGGESEETADDGWGRGRLQPLIKQPGVYLLKMSGEFIRFWKFIPDRVTTTRFEYRMEVHQEDERMVVDHPYASPLLNWVSLASYGPVFILALSGIVFCMRSWTLLSLPILWNVLQRLKSAK
jgi:4-amino-4-deoxy-L-arabinose transferase-like glycosyltransferase